MGRKKQTKNTKKIGAIIAGAALLLSMFQPILIASAQVPQTINYQSRLRTIGGVPITATTTIQFSLYNHISNGSSGDAPGSAGPLLWKETYDQVSGACGAVQPDAQGYFFVQLGSCAAFPSYIEFDSPLYLGVKIEADAEAAPRVLLASFPYALNSQRVNSLEATTTATGGQLLALENDLSFNIATGTYFGGGLSITGTSTLQNLTFTVATGTSLNLTNYLAIGAIRLDSTGTNNITSGAYLVGVFDEFTNSNATTVQAALFDLDTAITAVSSSLFAIDLQQVTDNGNTTTNAIQFAGGTSTGDIIPGSHDVYSLGNTDLRWSDVWGGIVHIGTSTWDLTQSDNAAFTISQNGGNERMRIESNGRVGIGTNQPEQMLSIRDNVLIGQYEGIIPPGGKTANLILRATDGFAPGIQGSAYTTFQRSAADIARIGMDTLNSINFDYWDGLSWVSRMMINSGGYIGMGTVTPTSTLHVVAPYASTTAITTIENDAGDYQTFNVQGSPEGYISGSIGDIAMDVSLGNMYVKVTGNSTSTGWERVFTSDTGLVTLDTAYDGGGSGAGRFIISDAGPIQITNTTGTLGFMSVTHSTNAEGLWVNNLGNGSAFSAINMGSAAGFYARNQGTGTGARFDNSTDDGTGLFIDNPVNGIGLRLANAGNNYGALVENTGGSQGIRIENGTNIGYGLYVNNTQLGQGIYVDNPSQGNAIVINNTGNRTGLRIINADAGLGGYIRNDLGTGLEIDHNSDFYGLHINNNAAGYGMYVSSADGTGIFVEDLGSKSGVKVHTTTGSGNMLELQNDDDARAIYIAHQGTQEGFWMRNTGTGSSLWIEDEAVDTSPFVLDADGYLGLGTATPGYTLDVVGDARIYDQLMLGQYGGLPGSGNEDGAVIYNTSSSTIHYWDGITWRTLATAEDVRSSLWDEDHDTGVQVEESADEDYIRFDTAGVERMYIRNDGYVGIGTDNPLSSLLTVGPGSHEASTFSAAGIPGMVNIANFRDENGENVFRAGGSVAGNDLVVGFGDLDYGGIGTSMQVNYGANAIELSHSEIRFSDVSGNKYVGLISPAVLATNTIWTLPGADGTINGQALATNASGTLYWRNVDGAGSVWDADGDTGIQVDNGTDNDQIELFSIGNKVAQFGNTPGNYSFEIYDISGNRIIGPGVTYIDPGAGAEDQNIGIGDLDNADNGTWLGVDTGTQKFGFNNGDIAFVSGKIGTSITEYRELLANGSNYVGFRAPTSVANNVAWTLPGADGTNNQVLITNGAGTLSWATSSDLVYNIYNSDGLIPEDRNVTIADGYELRFVDQSNPANFLYFQPDYNTNGNLRIGAVNNDEGNTNHYLEFMDNFKMVSQHGIEIDASTSQVDLYGNNAVLHIGADNQFYDLRAAGSRYGLRYTDDYSADFVARSLVDKEYVDNAIVSATTTLDMAYDGVGAGAGRFINTDSGPIQITNTTGSSPFMSVTHSTNAEGLSVNNLVNGRAFAVSNMGSGVGYFVRNQGSGLGARFENLTDTGTGLFIDNPDNGTGLSLLNEGSGLGQEIVNSGDGTGFSLVNHGNSFGQKIENNGDGIGLSIENSTMAGLGMYIVQNFGRGIVLDNNTLNNGLTINNNDNGRGIYIAHAGTGEAFRMQNLGTGPSLLIEDEAGDTTPFVLTADGSVGIGTGSPATLLHVQGGLNGSAVLTLDSDDGNNDGQAAGILINADYANGGGGSYIEFQNNGVFGGLFYASPNDVNLSIPGTNDYSVMIDWQDAFFIEGDNKNVGLSTSTPAYRLDVFGDARVSAQLMLGQYAVLPVSGQQAGALVYKTPSSTINYWDGATWRTVATADYVDNAITSSTVSAGNGLTLDSGVMKLGGALSEMTYIDHMGYDLVVREFAGETETLFAGDNFKIQNGDYEVRFGIGGPSSVGLTLENPSSTFSLLTFDDYVSVTSSRSDFLGLVYDKDYSSYFVDRSLVDKEYVDSHIGAAVTMQGAADNSFAADGYVYFDTGAAVWEDDGGYLSIRAKANGAKAEFGEDGGSRLSFTSGAGLGNPAKITLLDLRDVGDRRGIEYDDDYSADFVDRSLVDKAYVDNYLSASAGSGLTWDAINDEIDLGGSLTGNTTINYGNWDFRIQGGNSYQMYNNTNYVTYVSDGVDVTSLLQNKDNIQISGSAGFVGATYEFDYSANFVDRSLVDKEYVDNAITSSTLLFDNGLVNALGLVELGGSMTKNTDIDLDTYRLQFNATDGYHRIADDRTEFSYGYSYFTAEDVGFEVEAGDENETVNYYMRNNLFEISGYTSTSAINPNFHGATYGNDYSAYFVDRSLVDKEYVDNAIVSATTTLQAAYDAGGSALGRQIYTLNNANPVEILNPGTDQWETGLALTNASNGSGLAMQTMHSFGDRGAKLYFADDTSDPANASGAYMDWNELSSSFEFGYQTAGTRNSSFYIDANQMSLNIPGGSSNGALRIQATNYNIPILTLAAPAFPSSISMQMSVGTSTPESRVTANSGSVFFRTDGTGSSQQLYVKTTDGSNTGWFALAGADSNHWQKNTNVLSPTDSAVYQIAVTNNNASTLTGFKAVNTNDTSNYAGAVVEMKGSGADYTNNMYFGKYGAAFWIPSWAGNGVLATDKNLILGAVGGSSIIHYQIGGGYSAPVTVATMDSNSMDFQSGVDINAGSNVIVQGLTSSTRGLFGNATGTNIYTKNQFMLGQYAVNPTGGIRAGAMIYNTASSTPFFWDGSEWIAVATGTGFGSLGLQQVTDVGNVTTNSIQFAGATSTGNIIPGTNNTYTLGNTDYRWSDIWSGIVHVGTSTWDLAQADNGAFTISESGNSEMMRITTDGYVGIGTEVPEELLSLNDDMLIGQWDGGILPAGGYSRQMIIRATDGSLPGTQGTAYTTYQRNGVNYARVGLDTNNNINFGHYDGSWSNQVVISTSGNMGIGVFNPSYSLDVASNARFGAQMLLGQYALNPASGLQAGAMIYNTASSTPFFYNGSQWVSFAGSGSMWDTDHDTGVQVEESADEDIIRFDVAGSEVMKIDSTLGEPLVAINSPLGGYANILTNINDEYDHFEIRAADVLNAFGGDLVFNFNPEEGFALYYASNQSSMHIGRQSFGVAVNNHQDAIRVDDNAFVGLSTSSPIYRLDVVGDARLSAQFMLGKYALNPASGLEEGAIIYNTASSTPFFWDGSEWVAFATGTGAALNLQQVTDNGNLTTNWIQFAGGTSTGNFLINRPTAEAYLTVNSGNSDAYFDLIGNGGATALRMSSNGGGDYATFEIASNGSFNMVADGTSVIWGDAPTGNVGIGESSPNYRLHVDGGAAAGNNLFRAEAGLNNGYISMYVSSTDDRNSVIGFQRNLEFFSQDQMIMTITNSERLGIGITNPLYKLDVSGDARLSAQFMLGQYALNPASGLQAGAMIYNTASSTPFFWNGSAWKAMEYEGSITLDEAYDAGGAGLGRQITADSGAVYLTGAGNGTAFQVGYSGSGEGVLLENSGSGIGFRISQTGTGRAMYVRQNDGLGITLDNNTANNGVEINVESTGTGLQVNNAGNSSNGMRIDNDTDGSAIYIEDTIGKSAINIIKTGSSGDLIRMSNQGTGDGLDLSHASSGKAIRITNTGTGDSLFINDSAADTSPFVLTADGDLGIGATAPDARLEITGDNSLADVTLLKFQASNDSDIQSEIYFSGGSNATYWNVNSSGNGGALAIYDGTTEVGKFLNNGFIINDGSAAGVDFRVESDTNTHAMFVDATNGNVGFDQPVPLAKLHIGHTSAASVTDYDYLRMQGTGDVDHRVYLPSGSNLMIWDYNVTGNGGAIEFRNGASRVGLFTNTGLVVNEGGVTGVGLRVEGDTNANLLYTDATNDRVGVGTNAPDARFHVEQSGNIVAVFDRTTSDGTIISFHQGGVEEGTISVSADTISYNAFTGSHYAWTNENIEKGMLVSLTGENRNLHNNVNSEIMYGVTIATEVNDAKIMGSYLSLQEPGMASDEHNPHLIMAVGNGEAWVADKGENINIGDYFISSDIAGHAEKDTGEFMVSHIVARAAESVDWTHVSTQINGVKHKKISVFFESFDKNNIQDSVAGTSLQGGEETLENVDLVVADAVFEGNITVKGHVAYGKDVVGQAMIMTGDNRVTVDFTDDYGTLPIVTLTPAGKVTVPYWVENASLQGFDIVLGEVQYADILFNWHAFGNNEGRVYVSNGTTLDIITNDMGSSDLETQLNALGQDPENPDMTTSTEDGTNDIINEDPITDTATGTDTGAEDPLAEDPQPEVVDPPIEQTPTESDSAPTEPATTSTSEL